MGYSEREINSLLKGVLVMTRMYFENYVDDLFNGYSYVFESEDISSRLSDIAEIALDSTNYGSPFSLLQELSYIVDTFKHSNKPSMRFGHIVIERI